MYKVLYKDNSQKTLYSSRLDKFKKEEYIVSMDNLFDRLSKSKFRNSFHLKEIDKKYIKDKGIDTIKKHAYDFINKRLKPASPINDGKQTPTKGHPVFIAQHATACCCRSCLYKWHGIEKNRELTSEEISYIVKILMKWIQNETKILKK